ncbi:MAG: Uma2 family endonuclease [Bacteroidota bacterium]
MIKRLNTAPQAKLVIQEVIEKMEKEEKKRHSYYSLVHENIKAEFINGTIIYQSPVKAKHWKISSKLSSRLIRHVEDESLGLVAVEKAMISLTRNDYEPDICFWKKEIAERFSDDQMQFPAPDFIVEILSPSTEKLDRNEKFIDYSAHGVVEYWIVDPEAKAIEKYVNSDGVYQLVEKVKQGNLNSEVVKGFFIEITLLF